MLPKIIRTGIHRYEETGVRKTEMAAQYRKAYVPVTLDVDKEGAILPRLIWWDNGALLRFRRSRSQNSPFYRTLGVYTIYFTRSDRSL